MPPSRHPSFPSIRPRDAQVPSRNAVGDGTMTSLNFTAAQERVLARRTAREAEAQRQLQRDRFALSQSLSQSPIPLGPLAGPVGSLYSFLRRREGSQSVFRVGQVDAELLDEELLSLLKEQARDALKYFGPHFSDDWSQEILLVLRAALFKLSVWDHNASYGAVLQNLRYTDARVLSNVPSRPSNWQKSLYGLITVFGRYGWEKWESWLIDRSGGYAAPSPSIQTMMAATSLISTSHSIASFLSFLVFLVNGRYRTLTDRFLRLRLVPASSHLNRQLSFEYLNRQLVWHAFTEFLLFLLPLVGISRWRRWLGRMWRKAKLAFSSEDDAPSDSGPLAYLPGNSCAICYRDQNPEEPSEAEVLGVNTGGGQGMMGSATVDVVNPYQSLPCKCIYCFFCIATKIEVAEGEGWTCLRCGELIKSCRPWDGDVITSRVISDSNDNRSDCGDSDEQPSALTEMEPRPEPDEDHPCRPS